MNLKNNRTPLLTNIKFCATFHHRIWIQTGVTARKRLNWVLTSVTLTLDVWSWPFAWTSLLSLVISLEKFMMIRLQEHCEKGVTDGRTDRQTDGRKDSVLRAAWSQLKTRTTRTLAFWGYPRRLNDYPHYWVMLDPPSQNKVEWPWRYRSRSKVMTCNTPPHASDHLYQIWKESTQNCRRYRADTIYKVKAEWPWKYRSRSKVITYDTPSDANDGLC